MDGICQCCCAFADDDDDSAFISGSAPKLQRAISINLKTLIRDSPTPGSLASHSISPQSSPVSPIKSATPATVTSTAPITKSALPLVDYPDEDSDEDLEGTSPAKRSRVGSVWLSVCALQQMHTHLKRDVVGHVCSAPLFISSAVRCNMQRKWGSNLGYHSAKTFSNMLICIW